MITSLLPALWLARLFLVWLLIFQLCSQLFSYGFMDINVFLKCVCVFMTSLKDTQWISHRHCCHFIPYKSISISTLSLQKNHWVISVQLVSLSNGGSNVSRKVEFQKVSWCCQMSLSVTNTRNYWMKSWQREFGSQQDESALQIKRARAVNSCFHIDWG